MPVTPSAVSSRLPAAPDRFVGRAGHLQAALAQWQGGQERLLTVTGPGGVGKTRFVLELARQIEARTAQRAVWVDCADLRRRSEMTERVLEALGETVSTRPLLQLQRRLAQPHSPEQPSPERHRPEQTTLLILDNLEQISGVAALLGELLSTCPRLSVMATSRRPLRSAFERRYPLPPLECPPLEAKTAAEVVFRSEAAQLFTERARRILPSFAVLPEHSPLLSALCAQLDGLPLALELAACQVGHYSLSELLGRLRAGRALPASRERTPRQRSLEDNLSWGFGLLPSAAQELLLRLSVLEGSFGRELLGAFGDSNQISSNPDGSAQNTVQSTAASGELLEELVNSGWVKVTHSSGASVFRLLETVRVFALAMAVERGLEQPTWQALRDVLVGRALECADQLFNEGSASAIGWFERNWLHLRAALRWNNEHGEPEAVLRVLNASSNWHLNGSHLSEVVALLRIALNQLGSSGHIGAGHVGAGQLGASQLSPEQLSTEQVQAYCTLGAALEQLGHNQAAQQALEQASALIQRSPALSALLPRVERDLGNTHFAQFQLAQGQQCFERAIVLWQAQGSVQGEITTRHDLGCLLMERGEFAQARQQFDCALELLGDAENPLFRAAILLPMGIAAHYQGETALALNLLGQFMTKARALEMPVLEAHAHHNLGCALIDSDPAQAADHLQEAVALKRLHLQGFGLVESLGLLALFERTQGRLAESQSALLEAVKLADGMDVTLRLILPLEGLAALEAQRGDAQQAARLLGAADYLLASTAFHRYPEFEAQRTQTQAQLGAELGSALAGLLQEGQRQSYLPLLERYGLMLRYRPAPTPSLTRNEPGRLSPREAEVLQLLAQGMTNKQIAAQLQLSVHTISGFVVGLFNKLGCKTRAQAVSRAAQSGLL